MFAPRVVPARGGRNDRFVLTVIFTPRATVGTVNAIRTWWDGVEAWLTGLSFLPQLLVVLVVLIPVAVAAALTINLLVSAVLDLVGRHGDAADPVGGDR